MNYNLKIFKKRNVIKFNAAPDQSGKQVNIFVIPKSASTTLKFMFGLENFHKQGILDHLPVAYPPQNLDVRSDYSVESTPYGPIEDSLFTSKRSASTATRRDQHIFATFVRNPYTRTFSAYTMFRTLLEHAEDPDLINLQEFLGRTRCNNGVHGTGSILRKIHLPIRKSLEAKSFGAYVNALDKVRSNNTNIDPHMAPQHWYLPNGRNIHPKKPQQATYGPTRIKAVDFMGRIENFQEEWLRLSTLAGIRGNLEPPAQKIQPYYMHLLSGKRARFAKEMSQESANKICKIYKKDFDILGYDYDDYGGLKIV